MRTRVLVAEDDARQAEGVRRYLTAEGYDTIVVADGRAAIDAARRDRPDLLILDVMMPRVDGLDVCRVLRAESDVPILMLTARAGEDDLLLGLDLGADDYLTKPYSPRELMARVRTLLRRSHRPPATGHPVLSVGDLVVDPAQREVRRAGVPVPCTRGEFEVLAALAAEPGRVLTRQQLLQRTRGWESCSSDRTIDMHVLNLRRKLEDDPSRPRRVVTVIGVGYKLVRT
jgi:two-component system, OmpR family, response regulator MtrA